MMRGMKSAAAVLGACLALVAKPAYQQAASGAVLDDSFETGTVQSSLWNESKTAGCVYTVPSGGAAEGSRFLRSTLTVAAGPSPGNYRCELNARGVGERTQLGVPYYYHLALRVPSNAATDPAGELIMQLHQGAGAHAHHGIIVKGTSVIWQSNSHAGTGGPGADLGPLQKGVWNRWCIRAVWTLNSSGSLKVWSNPSSESDTPKFQWTGQTLSPTFVNAGKFKVGLYKFVWRGPNFPDPFDPAVSPRVIEHDEVRAGLSFADACGGSSSPRPEPPSLVAVE